MTEAYQILRTAILAEPQVFADYEGHARQMCPHVLGTNKTGVARALCYQFGGQSSKGLAPRGSTENWRCIAVARLSNVRRVDGPWHTTTNYSARTQTCVELIDVEAK